MMCFDSSEFAMATKSGSYNGFSQDFLDDIETTATNSFDSGDDSFDSPLPILSYGPHGSPQRHNPLCCESPPMLGTEVYSYAQQNTYGIDYDYGMYGPAADNVLSYSPPGPPVPFPQCPVMPVADVEEEEVAPLAYGPHGSPERRPLPCAATSPSVLEEETIFSYGPHGSPSPKRCPLALPLQELVPQPRQWSFEPNQYCETTMLSEPVKIQMPFEAIASHGMTNLDPSIPTKKRPPFAGEFAPGDERLVSANPYFPLKKKVSDFLLSASHVHESGPR